jgi:hypothetical protein
MLALSNQKVSESLQHNVSLHLLLSFPSTPLKRNEKLLSGVGNCQ